MVEFAHSTPYGTVKHLLNRSIFMFRTSNLQKVIDFAFFTRPYNSVAMGSEFPVPGIAIPGLGWVWVYP